MKTVTVIGRLLDGQGTPLKGAMVVNHAGRTVSEADGFFAVEMSERNPSLQVEFHGAQQCDLALDAGLAHEINSSVGAFDFAFGATIFVVELVSIAFLREFGVLLTAIILAGRTASAFTAQIGMMVNREEVDAMVICAEIGSQAQSLGGINELAEQTAPADRALEGIVEALSFRRNGLGKPFTLAVLVLALSARGLEDLYRECRHDAETVNGSWRVQFNNLRSYVECLPGWDGRLPFTDMMVATHNAHVARALHVLMRVS